MDIYEYRVDVYSPGTSTSQLPDLTGYDVDASDGHIGKIDEATNDAGSRCLVVDTGFWIFGKKRMIPAGVVQSIDADDKRVHVSMTKEQIKDAPDYDPDRRASDERGYRQEVGDYYGRHASRS
jgi:hypothetical protein